MVVQLVGHPRKNFTNRGRIVSAYVRYSRLGLRIANRGTAAITMPAAITGI